MINSANAAGGRKPWLDACRALAMILVIYGHIDMQTTAIASVIVPVKIPLFFVISGYLFNGQKTAGEYFRGLLFRLVIPWLFFAYAQYILGALVQGGFHLGRITWDIISGGVLWYMPCCILADVVFFFLSRMLQNRKLLAAACCLCFCVGYGMSRFGMGNTFAFNVALVSQLYMLLGRLYSWHEPQITAISLSRKRISTLVLAAAYLVLAAVNTLAYPDRHVDIHLNVYNCLPLTLVMIIIGCYLAFTIFQSIRIPRWLSFIGQNSLCFYLLHGRFKTIFRALFSMLHIPAGNVVVTSVIVTVLICLCLSVCALLINRCLPFIVGRKRTKRA